MKNTKEAFEEAMRERATEQDRVIRQNALECHAAMMETADSVDNCNVTWDGIMCWPSTSHGLLRALPCPSYVVGFNPQRLASKMCTVEGWYVSSLTNKTWTNYTQCYSDKNTRILVHHPDLENASQVAQFVPLVKAVSHVGYGVSLVTLIVAFCIFATFKRLRCPRNKLHMHLFASFMLRAFSTLFKNSLFVKGIGLASDFTFKDGERYVVHGNNMSWQCKLIVSLWQYFIMANYSWILMEGLYLHHLIFFSVFSDTSSIALFVVLGWGLPLLFVVPWVFVRAFLENTLCWTTNENAYYFQLIKGPTTASILVNFILFLNIVRVLLSKLNASISEETRRYRRWAKSTLVLVPLFGVHYAVFLTMSYLGVEGRTELIWLFIDQLFASFQGFFVAVLYCLLNGEVRAEVSRKWRRLPSWHTRAEHRASLPLTSLNQHSVKKSYLGAVFGRRRYRARHQNGVHRPSNADTSMSTTCMSMSTDVNTTTTFVSHNAQHRKSTLPDIPDTSVAQSEEDQPLN